VVKKLSRFKTVDLQAARLTACGITGIQTRESGRPTIFKRLKSDTAFFGRLYDKHGTINGRSLYKGERESQSQFWTRFVDTMCTEFEQGHVGPTERPPLLTIDLEATGLPGMAKDLLKIVEIGAVITDFDGKIMDELSVMINPGFDVLNHQDCGPAFRVTGIDRDEIMRRGIPYAEAPDRLRSWITGKMESRGIEAATSYNRSYDFGVFLSQDPWNIESTGIGEYECLMEWFQRLRFGRTGRLRGSKATDAAAWLAGRGHEVYTPPGHHRALWDARMEASIERGLSVESRMRLGGSPSP